MLRQLPRHRLNPLDRAALEIPRSEIRFHLLADFLPAISANFGVDAAIGDDLDVAVGQQQIDQHAVVMRGVPDPQVREDIERAFTRRLIAKQRRAVECAFDHETDLAGMDGLALFDRLLDCIQHARRKVAPRPPAVFEKMLADAFDTHGLTSFPTRRRHRNCRHRHRRSRCRWNCCCRWTRSRRSCHSTNRLPSATARRRRGDGIAEHDKDRRDHTREDRRE